MNDDIDARLAALEARVPVEAVAPMPMAPSARGGRRAVALVAAPVLVLVVGATALAGATVSGLLVRGSPGVENPGQPLHGANMECMTPPQAAAFLAARGYTNVSWQVESASKDTTGAVSAQPPVKMTTPPAHGYVVPGAIVDGQLLMVVDQRPGATGVGACAGMPMP